MGKGSPKNGKPKLQTRLRLGLLEEIVGRHIDEGVVLTDVGGTILEVNAAFLQMMGYEEKGVLGRNVRFLQSDAQCSSEVFEQLMDSLRADEGWQGPIPCSRQDGVVVQQWWKGRLYREPVSGRKYHLLFLHPPGPPQVEEEVKSAVVPDSLTGLPGRMLLLDRLNHALEKARRGRERRIAVLHIDLDRFKSINDSYGQVMGDQVLLESAERLAVCLRTSDTLAHLGADEFVMILEDLTDRSNALHTCTIVGQRITGAMAMPFYLEEGEVVMTASIGIAIFPEDGEDGPELMHNADSALTHAKKQGGNQYQYFTKDMNTLARSRLELENKLRRALAQPREFVPFYQPQLSLRKRAIVGVEALVRWLHPQDGLVNPGQFIPLAEETGLIVPIGERMLLQVCSHLKQWQGSGIGLYRASVNISPRQFKERNLLKVVRSILEESGIDPGHLQLEITESGLMENVDKTVEILVALKEMGLHLAIDDFGTGYSSLSYLKRFPIDEVKIDRAFVKDITLDPRGAALIKSIIAMAKSLDLRVIAEGIETPEQLEFLDRHGCDEIQGFLCSPPVPEEKFLALFRSFLQDGLPDNCALGAAKSA